MLHELYFKLLAEKPESIDKYNKDGKLYILGLYRLRDLFRNRTRTLQHIDGNTSSLHEMSNYEIRDFADEPSQTKEIEVKKKKNEI
jgi:hypothetical protein